MKYNLLKQSCFAINLLTSLIISPVIADESVKLSTAQVVQATLAAIPACLKYKIIGLCFWKVCFGPYCWIEETLKVDQYLPDAVVSIYRQENTNPWDYANLFIDPIAKQIGQSEVHSIMGFNMGFGNQSNSQPEEQNTHFKEADLIGNPAIALFSAMRSVFLPSQATTFMPYYLSQADSYIWRSPLIETFLYPGSLVPGLHAVGSLIDNWGNVYPRTGIIDQ